jgi:phosphoserine phosphatase
MQDLYVISAVGKDQPGLVHSVAGVLGKLSINIVDMEARSVRGHFMMFLVVDLSTSKYGYDEMMAELQPARAHFDLGVEVKPHVAGRRKTDKKMMVTTVMGPDRPGIVAALTSLIVENSLNIETMKMIARGEYIAMEVAVDTSDLEDISAFRKALRKFSDETGLDVSLRGGDAFQKPKRVVVFDCDSTVIQAEVIDELAKVAGVTQRVCDLTTRAMNGEIEFEEAIKERVRLLKGLTVDQLEGLTRSIDMTPGAEELINTLKSMGYKIAVISGGFTFFTNYLKERFNLEYVYANELELKDGVTTGAIKGEIIGAQQKADIIKQIADLENISVDQIVAVGDGANDRLMLESAGLGIGFNPKAVLKDYSDGIITSENIFGMLYFLGAPDDVLENCGNGVNGNDLKKKGS